MKMAGRRTDVGWCRAQRGPPHMTGGPRCARHHPTQIAKPNLMSFRASHPSRRNEAISAEKLDRTENLETLTPGNDSPGRLSKISPAESSKNAERGRTPARVAGRWVRVVGGRSKLREQRADHQAITTSPKKGPALMDPIDREF